MYAVALMLSASTATASLPYFHLGAITIPVIHLDIQSFGMLVAAGVLIGASLLRRYAEWHGVSDDQIRMLTGWVTISGFLGAHLFDVLAYQWDDLQTDPLLLIKVWSGISSYGGFIGGAVGFALYVWWKRLPPRLMADITIVGLLPAFSIGRIGCTVVSDHVGAAVDPSSWYSGLAMDYPRTFAHLNEHYPALTGATIRAWNLGLIELLYLIPVNALILWLAFRKKRMPAGFLVVLAGALYAPVRFGLDFLRPEDTDPRYGSLTFAQWASFLCFGVSIYVLARIMRNGKIAEVVAPTSGAAQALLRKALETPAPQAKPAAKADDGKPDDSDEAGEAGEGREADEADDPEAAAEPAAAKPASSANKAKRTKGGGGKNRKK